MKALVIMSGQGDLPSCKHGPQSGMQVAGEGLVPFQPVPCAHASLTEDRMGLVQFMWGWAAPTRLGEAVSLALQMHRTPDNSQGCPVIAETKTLHSSGKKK